MSASGAGLRQGVSRQRKRRGDRTIENAIEEGTDARTRFETSWLIVRDDVGAGCGSPEVLTLGAGVEGDGWILPVFSFEEEALLFLRLCRFGSGWRARKSGIADLGDRSFPTPGRTSGKSPSTRSPRSAPTGRTTSSACHERCSSDCCRREMMLGIGPPRYRLRRATPTPKGQLEPKRDRATVDDARLHATSPTLAWRGERTSITVGKDQIL